MKIIVAGSSGFVGSHLVNGYSKEHQLVLLSRHPQPPKQPEQVCYWNPEEGQIDPSLLEGADVVINLCGENILGRWTQKKMEQIRASRLIPTQFLCDTLASLFSPPKLYIGASAIGFYGDRPGEILDERSQSGHGYLAEVCRLWEAIPSEGLAKRSVRVCLTRFGMILGHGGALKLLEKIFRAGMGGVLGSGEQMMSWIAIDDVQRAIDHLIFHSEIEGPVNFVTPHPVSNRLFTEALARVLHRPARVASSPFALKMMLGPGAEVFLSSTAVQAYRLLESGFTFQYSDLNLALQKYLLINT
jgi:uncharacterized protein